MSKPKRTINVQRDGISLERAMEMADVDRIEDDGTVWVLGRRGWRQLGVYDG